MAVVEGETDAFGHVRLAGIGQRLEEEIRGRTGKDARATVLGHIQRGGTPTAYDRVLATRFGLYAIDAVHREAWGTMTALRGTAIELVPIADAVGVLKTVPAEMYDEAGVFFG
jgi:6-phosphofructokinase 1